MLRQWSTSLVNVSARRCMLCAAAALMPTVLQRRKVICLERQGQTREALLNELAASGFRLQGALSGGRAFFV
jgi:hypothetical protein